LPTGKRFDVARAGLTPVLVEQAAVELADSDGLDAVSLSAVARRLGVQPASMYAHVSGIAALLDRLHRRGLGELADLIAESTAGRSGRDALEAFTNAHRRLAENHPGLWQALQRPASAETVGSPEAARVASLSLAMLRGYDLDDDDGVHATRFVGATINGLLTLARVGSFDHRDASLEDSWRRSVDALDRALRTWHQTT